MPSLQLDQRYAHHRRAIRAVLDDMSARGYEVSDCLSETGLNISEIDDDTLRPTLAQEYAFYRNVLRLRKSPAVGLQLGELFGFETYGLLGYAMLSSTTVSEAIQTAADFAPLTFSHFKINKVERDGLSGVAYSQQKKIPNDLLQVYSDRDVSAALTGLRSIINDGVSLAMVCLAHSDCSDRRSYENFFNCEVKFGCHRNELLIEKKHAERPLPRRDQEAAAQCREQCQKLLQRLSQTEATADRVRSKLVEQPGHFPGLEEVAGELNIGVRTLRRLLRKEGTSYQLLLQEIRRELAEEYLSSNMSIESIASRLGYSEAANFSHAFKRWSGESPRAFRDKIRNANSRIS